MTSSANERYEWERGRGQGGNIGKRGPAHHISVSTYQHHRFTLFFLPSTSPSLRRPCYPRHRSRKRRPPSLSFSSPHVLFFHSFQVSFSWGWLPGAPFSRLPSSPPRSFSQPTTPAPYSSVHTARFYTHCSTQNSGESTVDDYSEVSFLSTWLGRNSNLARPA